MTVDELLQVLRERDAVLYVQEGHLKYKGPRRAPDDLIRSEINTHRAELIELFTVRPAIHPAASPDVPPSEMLEPTPSAACCVFCPAPLAEGDPIACSTHRERLSVTHFTPQPSVAVTLAPTATRLSVTLSTPDGVVSVTSCPAIGREDLLAIAALRDWEALPFKPGESAGGSEEAWRTFCGWARGETLRLVLATIWEHWRETVEQYAPSDAMAAPESPEAA